MTIAAHFGWLLPALLGSLAIACVEPAGATRIVGPDGTRMLHVHCAEEQVACFQLAGQLCPSGYDLSPIFDPHDGNFLVRCKSAFSAAAAVIASGPAPQPLPAPPSSAPQQTVAVAQPRPPENGWPPTEVTKPSEPWPAPNAGAPPARAPDVDLGY